VSPKVWGRPIDGLGEMVAENSEQWNSASEGGLAAILDGKVDTRGGVRHEDRASFVIDLQTLKTLSGLWVHAGGQAEAAGGVSVHLKVDKKWEPVLVRRLIGNDGWSNLSFHPTQANQVRITLHGFPSNDNITINELQLIEQVER